MSKQDNGSLQAMARKMLRQRICRQERAENSEAAQQLFGRTGHTVTVAQAIVLAIGQRALDGDKTAAEYLQKLADQQEQKQAMEEDTAEKDLVIRIRMADEAPTDGADERSPAMLQESGHVHGAKDE